MKNGRTVIAVAAMFLIVSGVAGFLFGVNQRLGIVRPEGGKKDESYKGTPIIDTPADKGTTALKISAVGDIMLHMPQIASASKGNGSFDFTRVFGEIMPYLKSSDITIGNLETTIADPGDGYSGYPKFRSPEQLLDALKASGFDILTTANNHSLDGAGEGVADTIKKLDRRGLLHTGTAVSAEEDRFVLIEKNGIKLAVLAYTYGTNGNEKAVSSKDLDYMVNYDEMNSIRDDIKKAREAGAEVIIVCMHWGVEKQRTVDKNQKYMADRLLAERADIILGSHPHVLQPVQIKRSADKIPLGDSLTAFSLGNFLSDQQTRYTRAGVILNINLEKDLNTGLVRISGADYVPTWVYRYYEKGKAQFKILPAGKHLADKKLKAGTRSLLNQAWKDTVGLLGSKELNPIK